MLLLHGTTVNCLVCLVVSDTACTSAHPSVSSSIDNVGEDTVTVLGREWRIFNGDGSLHREIRRGTSESRMVVGLQPILEPGDSFIYHSGTDVKSRSGHMEGSFQVGTRTIRTKGRTKLRDRSCLGQRVNYMYGYSTFIS